MGLHIALQSTDSLLVQQDQCPTCHDLQWKTMENTYPTTYGLVIEQHPHHNVNPGVMLNSSVPFNVKHFRGVGGLLIDQQGPFSFSALTATIQTIQVEGLFQGIALKIQIAHGGPWTRCPKVIRLNYDSNPFSWGMAFNNCQYFWNYCLFMT